ncbi:MAG: hypothetical protein SOR94_07685 [Lawsonella sp.]|uniref:hypothetical protein n=1 Tax=Lawsonella sp. TaxID=2041415 RepID=UPI002A76683E|nr:hypothetical protein [Lawsonella sp.]MDY2979892.1 hypothetical protein [Lawsonella sp.]
MNAPLLFYPRTTHYPLTLEWVVGPGLVRLNWSGGVTEGRDLATQGALPEQILGYLERGELAHLSLAPGLITTTLPADGSWQEKNTGGTALATRLRRDLFAVLSTPNEQGELGWPTGTLDVPTLGGQYRCGVADGGEGTVGGCSRGFRRLTWWQYAAGQRARWGSAH